MFHVAAHQRVPHCDDGGGARHPFQELRHGSETTHTLKTIYVLNAKIAKFSMCRKVGTDFDLIIIVLNLLLEDLSR